MMDRNARGAMSFSGMPNMWDYDDEDISFAVPKDESQIHAEAARHPDAMSLLRQINDETKKSYDRSQKSRETIDFDKLKQSHLEASERPLRLNQSLSPGSSKSKPVKESMFKIAGQRVAKPNPLMLRDTIEFTPEIHQISAHQDSRIHQSNRIAVGRDKPSIEDFGYKPVMRYEDHSKGARVVNRDTQEVAINNQNNLSAIDKRRLAIEYFKNTGNQLSGKEMQAMVSSFQMKHSSRSQQRIQPRELRHESSVSANPTNNPHMRQNPTTIQMHTRDKRSVSTRRERKKLHKQKGSGHQQPASIAPTHNRDEITFVSVEELKKMKNPRLDPRDPIQKDVETVNVQRERSEKRKHHRRRLDRDVKPSKDARNVRVEGEKRRRRKSSRRLKQKTRVDKDHNNTNVEPEIPVIRKQRTHYSDTSRINTDHNNTNVEPEIPVIRKQRSHYSDTSRINTDMEEIIVNYDDIETMDEPLRHAPKSRPIIKVDSSEVYSNRDNHVHHKVNNNIGRIAHIPQDAQSRILEPERDRKMTRHEVKSRHVVMEPEVNIVPGDDREHRISNFINEPSIHVVNNDDETVKFLPQMGIERQEPNYRVESPEDVQEKEIMVFN